MNAWFAGLGLGMVGLLLTAVLVGEAPPEHPAGQFSRPPDPFLPAHLPQHGAPFYPVLAQPVTGRDASAPGDTAFGHWQENVEGEWEPFAHERLGSLHDAEW